MPTATSEADIIFNRANVALAKSQRLIASWLPPRTEEELRNVKSEEEIEREEEEMFAPVPELYTTPLLRTIMQRLIVGSLGLGAPIPKDIKDGSLKRQELSSNDKLRKQLLGKDFMKLYGKSKDGSKLGSVASQLGSKPRPPPAKTMHDDDEDEGGRSSLGKSKRKQEDQIVGGDNVEDDSVTTARVRKANLLLTAKPLKRRNNYLDEVLADKSKRQKKKRRKNKAVAAES
ncbi:hypothetical protein MMC24_004403 [Lignoscripta atroalba]|nr:hypothetical protein [Lignoscripta atroalba]